MLVIIYNLINIIKKKKLFVSYYIIYLINEFQKNYKKERYLVDGIFSLL